MGNLEIKNLDIFENKEGMIDISGCKLEPITDDSKPNKYHPIYMYVPEKRTMELGYMDEDNNFRTINGNPVDLIPSCYVYCPTNEEGYYILNYENYDISSDVILDSDYFQDWDQDTAESQKPFNLYDAFIREYGNDYEQIKFIVHNHKLYLGIKYNGDYSQVERFMKTFTDPSIKVPNDIEIHKYYTNHETRYNIFAHATPGTCSEVTVGDYIFRSNDDFHFFAKRIEDVEADNDNYIEIDPIFAGVMLSQRTTNYYNEYINILKEKKIINKDDSKINGVVLKFKGTKKSADDIDATLVKLQEMDSSFTFEITDENGYSFRYSTFRLAYDNENNQAFLIKYNFRYIDTPLELYCDFPDIEVYRVKEGDYIIFDYTHNLYKNNNYIIRIIKDENTAKRIMNHILSKIS